MCLGQQPQHVIKLARYRNGNKESYSQLRMESSVSAQQIIRHTSTTSILSPKPTYLIMCVLCSKLEDYLSKVNHDMISAILVIILGVIECRWTGSRKKYSQFRLCCVLFNLKIMGYINMAELQHFLVKQQASLYWSSATPITELYICTFENKLWPSVSVTDTPMMAMMRRKTSSVYEAFIK